MDLKQYLNQTIEIIVDRPVGSKHPKFNYHYGVNYGYVPNTKAPDGEEIDAYLLGVNEPVERYTGKCIAIIHRTDDDDDKLIIAAPESENLSDDEIMHQIHFQEKYFHSVLIR